ncbi:hypothetical protein RZS08_10540, partial [Arthrospira platensis SPKY1]|nr:hypothetical protein [Arthrospira platensis SPKY1]
EIGGDRAQVRQETVVAADTVLELEDCPVAGHAARRAGVIVAVVDHPRRGPGAKTPWLERVRPDVELERMAGPRPAGEFVAGDGLGITEEGRVKGGEHMALTDEEGGADLAAGIDQHAHRAQQGLVGVTKLALIGDEDIGHRLRRMRQTGSPDEGDGQRCAEPRPQAAAAPQTH